MFTCSSAIVQDLFSLGKKATITTMRKTILILAILGTIVSIILQDLFISTYIFASFILSLAVIVMISWIRKRIRQTTILYGFYVGIIGTIALLFIYGLFLGGIQPALVVYAIALTLIGLLIGGIVSHFKKLKRRKLLEA